MQAGILKGNILIVDDKPSNLRLLAKMLLERGHTVQTVTSGLEALDQLSKATYDLVLLDVMMPQMDGYEVCRHMKAAPQTSDIPVIFLSALDNPQDKVVAFNAGGVDYITKPFKLQEVLARVETHLMLVHLQRRLVGANAELAQHLNELAEANAVLQVQNEELDAFAHTVAHDLKNPLGLIAGYAELLYVDADTLEPGQVSNYAHFIMRGANKMRDIINNLLLLASARKKDVGLVVLDMAEVVAEALDRLVDVVEKKQATMILPESWPVALGFAPWVEEIWANYISNALKYGGRSEDGIPPCITLGYDAVPSADPQASQADSPAMWRFWVKDNGLGLSEEQQTQLFTPFERLNQAQIQGHGLGLSIVRRIVERLDGEAGVESEPGQGSLFYFTLRSG